MTRADQLNNHLVELKRLRRSRRKTVLDALAPEEREQIEELLQEVDRPQPRFDALASLSPWLVECLAAARRDEGEGKKVKLTPATCSALRKAELLLVDAGSPQSPRESVFRRIGLRWVRP